MCILLWKPAWLYALGLCWNVFYVLLRHHVNQHVQWPVVAFISHIWWRQQHDHPPFWVLCMFWDLKMSIALCEYSYLAYTLTFLWLLAIPFEPDNRHWNESLSCLLSNTLLDFQIFLFKILLGGVDKKIIKTISPCLIDFFVHIEVEYVNWHVCHSSVSQVNAITTR